MSNQTTMTYEVAYAELQEIMEQLQHQEVSIDELEERVKRATELIRFCTEKLRGAERNIADILRTIEEEGE